MKPVEFPILTTERCILRKIVSSDQQKIYEGLSHTEVIKYYGISYSSFEATKAQMQFYDDLLKNETGIWWAVCLKDNNEFIGAAGFNNRSAVHRKAEIGFWLLPSCQQKGYMSEAVKAILDYGYSTMQLHRIEAVVETGNEYSTRLLQRLGFVYEGTHHECEIKNGNFIDLMYFARLD